MPMSPWFYLNEVVFAKRMADGYVDKGDFKHAKSIYRTVIRKCTKAIALDAMDEKAYKHRGACYFELSKFHEDDVKSFVPKGYHPPVKLCKMSIADYNRFLELHSQEDYDKSVTYCNLGTSYSSLWDANHSLKTSKLAIDAFTKSIEINESLNVKKPQPYEGRAQILENIGDGIPKGLREWTT